jgi:hypothetical protein
MRKPTISGQAIPERHIQREIVDSLGIFHPSPFPRSLPFIHVLAHPTSKFASEGSSDGQHHRSIPLGTRISMISPICRSNTLSSTMHRLPHDFDRCSGGLQMEYEYTLELVTSTITVSARDGRCDLSHTQTGVDSVGDVIQIRVQEGLEILPDFSFRFSFTPFQVFVSEQLQN